MKKTFFIIFFVFFAIVDLYAQLPKLYKTNEGWLSDKPLSNTINDILVAGDTVWFGTGGGLSLTNDEGRHWIHFSNTATFDSKGISALAKRNNTICIATGYTTKLGDESVQTGGGLHFSSDNGMTWRYIPQPVDYGTVDTLEYGSKNKIRAMAISVAQQNITFDIAITDRAIWTASWAGMLRTSTDSGNTWRRVVLPPDNLSAIDTSMDLNYAFDLSPSAGRLGLTENDNHKVFSICASNDTTLWVGTAGGINKSVDGGLSWQKFSHQNQSSPISGNWVVALKEQSYQATRILWAGTRNTQPDEIQALSYSTNGGETWQTALHGERIWNIDWKDSIVYVATDNGIFQSPDFGESWIQSGSIFDPSTLQRFVNAACYGIGVQEESVWYGGPEGIASTPASPAQAFGSTWKIFRTYVPINRTSGTYAYPNPFAPDDEPIRLHYSLGTENTGQKNITIRIFDYAMLPIRTLVQNISRASGREYDEVWDGRNDNRSIVRNGVYFYRIEIDGQEPVWGKILAIQ